MGQGPSLDSVGRAAVDTSVFIYLFEARPPRGPKAVQLFDAMASSTVVTSIITPIEVLTHCKREGQTELEKQYVRFFLATGNLVVMPVDWEIAERAAEIRARHRLRTPDAIQAATAIVAGAKVFLTNDRRLAKVDEVNVVVFDGWAP